MSVSNTFGECLCVSGGWGWSVDGGLMPLSTCPQRYCNPVLCEKRGQGEREGERENENGKEKEREKEEKRRANKEQTGKHM